MIGFASLSRLTDLMVNSSTLPLVAAGFDYCGQFSIIAESSLLSLSYRDRKDAVSVADCIVGTNPATWVEYTV
jgi:hypothetical protein